VGEGKGKGERRHRGHPVPDQPVGLLQAHIGWPSEGIAQGAEQRGLSPFQSSPLLRGSLCTPQGLPTLRKVGPPTDESPTQYRCLSVCVPDVYNSLSWEAQAVLDVLRDVILGVDARDRLVEEGKVVDVADL